MAGNITNELISRLGMKNLSKGVKVDVLEGVVTVSLALNLNTITALWMFPQKYRRESRTLWRI